MELQSHRGYVRHFSKLWSSHTNGVPLLHMRERSEAIHFGVSSSVSTLTNVTIAMFDIDGALSETIDEGIDHERRKEREQRKLCSFHCLAKYCSRVWSLWYLLDIADISFATVIIIISLNATGRGNVYIVLGLLCIVSQSIGSLCQVLIVKA